MKIGLLAPPWLPIPSPAYGGIEAMLDGLARGLVGLGHEVLLWTVGESTCPVPRGHTFDHAWPDRIGDAAVELPHVIAGYQGMADWGADVVHDHTLTGPLVASLRGPARVVTTAHGPIEGPLASVYALLGQRMPVVAISRSQASRATDVRIATVIHHGIDVDTYPMGNGQGDADGEHFTFLGRMTPDKGVDLAVLAAHRAGVRLMIAAKMHSVEERAYYTERIEPLLGDGVVYVGEIGLAEKAALLGRSRALLNPIRWSEPFGLAMIEALACGTPVIASCVGSVPEIVEDGVTGYVCRRVDDSNAAIDELVRSMHDVSRLDRAACRRSVRTNFSTERMVADHVALYGRVLSAPSTSAAGAGASAGEAA